MFIDQLIKKIKEKKNPSVVGLDPRIEFVPQFIKDKYTEMYKTENKSAAYAMLEYNKFIIDAIKDIVPCVKPQIAFYEAYGIEGLEVFKETVKYAKENGLLVLADVKRGDIGSTAKAYAQAYLGGCFIEVDSITVNPYLGEDSITPFTEYCDLNKGIFILAKTSNKSSEDLQDLISEDKRIYEIVAEHIKKWGEKYIGDNGYSSVGAVIGATYPEVMKRLREVMKNAYFLVPGYGAQGGTALDVVHSFNEDGLGAIINSSRGIIAAHLKDKYKDKYKDEEFYLAIRQAAIEMRDDINNALEKNNKLYY
ncbi:orotidine-5'-phosphate decarboxylase [Caldisalinibacter kiritimatiensis]|uniref:Orotidine 5'-phosphate decarboxylase n=1 Tax=Caldisalinibacter kiritimatiensis TaxID=1304284 RepID=R1CG56_9FIRM|nr:orotidine-5'-phosphate decarboxylase [Caldisalinibacter kiritimatiensis]EOD01300.1 Orotidine 5'-phosphate decarboxylase [Caldisalinibacter kiritimatiensis]